MTTIYSRNADGQERYDTVLPERVAKTIKQLRNRGQFDVRVVPNVVSRHLEPLETPIEVEVAPGIYQSKEDFDANMAYDEWRDEQLTNEL